MRRAAPFVLLLFVACSSSLVWYQKQEQDTFYIGASKQHGGAISDAEWQQFLHDVVSPQFPGYTYWRAHGMWMNQSEETFVLVIVHEQGHEAGVQAILDQGKLRLDQQEIFHVREDVWLRENQPVAK